MASQIVHASRHSYTLKPVTACLFEIFCYISHKLQLVVCNTLSLSKPHGIPVKSWILHCLVLKKTPTSYLNHSLIRVKSHQIPAVLLFMSCFPKLSEIPTMCFMVFSIESHVQRRHRKANDALGPCLAWHSGHPSPEAGNRKQWCCGAAALGNI